MGTWQRSMIALATNGRIRGWAERRRLLSDLATRFVGGRDVQSAIAAATELEASGKRSSLFYLGEYVDDPVLVDRTVAAYEAIVPALARAGLDVHVSVDPTAIGAMIGDEVCRASALRIGRAVGAAIDSTSGAADAANAANADATASHRSFLMLDMEDSSVTDSTIDLYERLRSEGLPAAVTLQAYLHRFEADVRRAVGPHGAIRLVKGALAEPASRAATSREEIDRRYRVAAALMLAPGARDAGFYPIFATHDVPLIRDLRSMARENGWQPGEYEFEMLYGVRRPLQDALVARGERLRLYVPFGEAWWPYAVRRVGENPRNVGLLVKAMLGAR